ncbi:MAG: cyclase family protein [Bacillota bacterium]
MRIYDISMTLGDRTVVWPGNRPVEVVPELHSPARVSRLVLTSHSGTHVDAPAHFVPGAETIDMVPLDRLVGPARVIEIPGDSINAVVLRSAGVLPGEIVLFKTANSDLAEEAAFADSYVGISRDGAGYLTGLPVRAVGIDYLSVELPDDDYVHFRLLEAGIPVIEGLRLAGVPPGEYLLACLPLKIRGGDGAPARAVLISPSILSTE